MSLIGETPSAAPADLIKEGTDAGFAKDVIEASKAHAGSTTSDVSNNPCPAGRVLSS